MFTARTTMDRYRSSLQRVEMLDAETERQLARAWAAGDQDAGRRLVESSLPFVIGIARKYVRWGIPLEDLVQQGNLGLLKAAERFDTDKECRLVTYAAYWIRAEIRDYVVRGYRIVRLGTTRTERRALRSYRKERIESPEELAERSGMPEKRARQLWPVLTQGDQRLDHALDPMAVPRDRLCASGPTPEEACFQNELSTRVRQAVSSALQLLSDREQRIVKERLLADEPRTLASLGREMGVSKERVRQLEARARDKLRVHLAEFAEAA